MKSLKILKGNLMVKLKITKILMAGLTKLLFLEKISFSVYFDYSFSKAWFFDIVHQVLIKIHFKIKSSKVFECSMLQAKKFGDPPT